MDAAAFYNNYLTAGTEDLAGYGFALQETVNRYPWFSLAHLLLFKSLCALGGDAYLSQAEKAAAYAYRRAVLFQIVRDTRQKALQTEEEWFTLDFDSEEEVTQSRIAVALETAPEEVPPQGPEVALEVTASGEVAVETKITGPDSTGGLDRAAQREIVLEAPSRRVFLVGADYFGKADMAQVTLDDSAPVDRFIRQQPRFTQVFKRPGEEIDVEQQEQSPALADDDCVTETLARIYAQQGYNKLAISCYGKLILLYPKKSSYFATLIEEIKEKSNS